MKKTLTIFGTITLIGTGITSLVACNNKTKIHEYTKEQLAKLKKENEINTTDKNIKNNLEWIAPQEKPFNQINDKYYFVVWRGDENLNWKIIKFKNINFSERRKVLDTQEDYELALTRLGNNLFRVKTGAVRPVTSWPQDDGTYFKSVYHWNLDTQEPNLVIDNDGNVKINE